MKKQRFVQLLDEQRHILGKLTASKGNEYARSEDDQLANFKRQALELNLQPEQIWAVYFNKHLDSIKSYLKHNLDPNKPGPVLSEPIEGRIDDAILYLVLFKAILIEKRENELNPT